MLCCLKDFWKSFYDRIGWIFNENEVGVGGSIVACLTATFGLAIAGVYAMKSWGLTNWNRNVIKNKKRLRALHFQKLSDELNVEDEEELTKRRQIVSYSFAELRERLQSGELTATQVVTAFRWKSLQCQQKFNCLTEFVREAPQWAEQLDRDFAGKKKPPLFGLPFSVKDNFYMVGYDCTRGLAKECDWPMNEESSLVSHLRSLGAVPIVRTNVPQLLLHYVCSNPVYGTTGNPYDPTRSPGGSSGGEGCVVAAGGVAFGIGSDLAGSLRIPAHFCGLHTLKPTERRLKVTGTHPGVPGGSRLALAYGFFTKDISTLTFLFELTIAEEYFRRVPQTVPLPLNMEGSDNRVPLKIGYFTDDGWLTPVPSCQRAVEIAKNVLEQQGHQLIPFTVPRPRDAYSVFVRCLIPDNGKFVLDAWRYEEVDPLIKQAKMLFQVPIFLRRLIAATVGKAYPEIGVLCGAYNNGLADARATYAEADAYVAEFTDKWCSSGLDALVCPAFPVAALPHEYPVQLPACGLATALFNLLDYPSGVVPVTTVNDEDERCLMEEYPNEEAAAAPRFALSYPIHNIVRKASRNSQGLPVGVQVVTLPYQEETCLTLMKLLETNAFAASVD